jgi:hypothetical protein
MRETNVCRFCSNAFDHLRGSKSRSLCGRCLRVYNRFLHQISFHGLELIKPIFKAVLAELKLCTCEMIPQGRRKHLPTCKVKKQVKNKVGVEFR